jgi:hypothetical protein
MKNYIPDSVYTICGEYTQDCGNCSNNVYSSQLGGPVHDSQRGKVLCPFGTNGSMNKSVFGDQGYINKVNNYQPTTWGRAPQLNPRPLAKIGLEWRTS